LRHTTFRCGSFGAVHCNSILVALIIQLGIVDGTCALANLTSFTTKVWGVVAWSLNLIALILSTFSETLGSPVAFDFVSISLVTCDTKIFLEIWVVLEVASCLLSSDFWSTEWISTLTFTS